MKHEKPRVVGIVAEYNPFHNGHLHHLKEAIAKTQAEYAVAVMSGNFLQRGEMALYDKWVRAEATVRNGVDVVLELPTAFACNSAEFFAAGAITLLERVGCITHLAFGAEHNDVDILSKISKILINEPEDFKNSLKAHLDKGIAYPKARSAALVEQEGLAGLEEVLKSPNNILGIEYIKQLLLLYSSIEPVAIKRHMAGYSDEKFYGNMASATAIRKILIDSPTYDVQSVKSVIPDETYKTIEKIGKEQLVNVDMLFGLLQYRVRTMSAEGIQDIFSVGEGLENKIIKSIIKAENYKQFLEGILSKRYTLTRVQRTIMHLLLGLTKQHMGEIMADENKCLYGRVLAVSPKGRALLALMKKEELNRIPIYTNINKEAGENIGKNILLTYDLIASDIYNILRDGGKKSLYSGADRTKKPFIL